MDWLQAGWQENHSHACRRNSGGIYDHGLYAGGVLSPLLWSLVVDEIIEGLNGNDCYTLGYADVIAILICGKFWNAVSELVQEASVMVQQWCDRTQLSINPQKMVIVPFTRKEIIGV
jgi:hypothetical protein